ncbi:hypothetical protein EK21DRAFT_86316 [Setomelanomma holmii]|uniref:Uncharacterized protein n=1 Tax=Setomelanomma holmii TaxID=210430 RepID=A0A9P4LS84_9PLEO|nr:hypothetical protein EK21DRAFT_86316 [Setomelanomma holmii]
MPYEVLIISRYLNANDRSYEIGLVSQTVGAARWLYSLDTRAALHAVPLVDLIRRLWQHPDIEVQSVHPKGPRHYRYHESPNPSQHRIDIVPEVLNAVTLTLKRDPLGLAKYGRQVEEVLIQRDCKEGRVVFQLPYVGMGSPKRHFSISDDRKTLTWKVGEAQQVTLMTLLREVKWKVFDIISLAPPLNHKHLAGNVTWDLDNSTLSGASLSLSAVCCEGRRSTGPFWMSNYQRLELSASRPDTDFDNFTALKRLWRTYDKHISKSWQFQRFHDYNKHPTLDIVLIFNDDFEIELADLHIDVGELLHNTASVGSISKLTISTRNIDGKFYPRGSVWLEHCIDNALAKLPDALINHPYWQWVSSRPHLSVQMNGLFEIFEASVKS